MTKRQRSNPGLAPLARLDLFHSCTDVQLADFLPDTDIITVAAGTVIDRSGTYPEQFVGIIDGYVEALDDDGSSTVLASGDHFGAAQLFDQDVLDATYTAITASSLVVIFGPSFRADARRLPAVVARAISSASRSAVDALTAVG